MEAETGTYMFMALDERGEERLISSYRGRVGTKAAVRGTAGRVGPNPWGTAGSAGPGGVWGTAGSAGPNPWGTAGSAGPREDWGTAESAARISATGLVACYKDLCYGVDCGNSALDITVVGEGPRMARRGV